MSKAHAQGVYTFFKHFEAYRTRLSRWRAEEVDQVGLEEEVARYTSPCPEPTTNSNASAFPIAYPFNIPNGIQGAQSESGETPRNPVSPQRERQSEVAGIEEHLHSPPLCTRTLPRIGPNSIGTNYGYASDRISMRAASLRLPKRVQ